MAHRVPSSESQEALRSRQQSKSRGGSGKSRDANLFLQHEQTLPKVGKVATFSPVVDTQASFSECVQLEQDKDLVFQECWNWQNVKEAVAEVSPRVMNRVTLQQHLAEVGKEAKQAGPGRRSADAQHGQAQEGNGAAQRQHQDRARHRRGGGGGKLIWQRCCAPATLPIPSGELAHETHCL